MRSLAPLVATAAMVVATAIPTAAAADPACVSVGYRVLGGGTDHSACVPTPFPTHNVTSEPGIEGIVELRVSVDFPLPTP